MSLSTAVARILTAGALIGLAGPAAAQQAYPSKPIRLIVPFPPGGSNNVVARLIGQKLTESWSQPVIVDNRPGASTIIGSEALLKSPPDGYTLMLTSSTHVITPLLIPTPYDAVKDFAPVATIVSAEYVLVVHPSLPANNLQEFIALAKSKPGQLNYATTGAGGSTHLVAAFLEILAGVKMQHVPYKGGGPALIDLISGQVQLFLSTPPPLVAHIKSRRLKAIAITGEARFPTLPQVPTFTEAGLPGFEVKGWYGVLAPAGTPKAIIDRLSAEIARIVAMPDTREKLNSQGVEAFISTPEQFAALIEADMAKWAKVIKTANIKLDQ